MGCSTKDTAGGACELRRRKKKIATPARVIATTLPTRLPMTPPAMAAVFGFVLFFEPLPSWGEGVGDPVLGDVGDALDDV
jgi:hypothetical protein